MAQSEQTKQIELPAGVSHCVEAQRLGTPIKELVMESTLRFNFLWFIIIGTVLAFIPIGIAVSTRTPLSLAFVGLYLLSFVGLWIYYFSAPFKRFGKQHAMHIFICPNGMVGVRGGSMVYTYHWAQVKAVTSNNYGRAGSECKLQLMDGREVTIKSPYQPVPHGLWNTDTLVSVIEGALANFRSQQRG